VGAFFDVVDLGLATALAAVAGVWLVAKDWRDLVPSKRDSASWQLGLQPAGGAAPWVAPVRLAAPHSPHWRPSRLGSSTSSPQRPPNSGWRHRFLLRNVESLDEIRVFHALALPAAAALIVTAFYLYRRRRGALNVAVALLLALGVLNLVKGLDFEEALWELRRGGPALVGPRGLSRPARSHQPALGAPACFRRFSPVRRS